MQENPLREYLDDQLFFTLWEKGFLNERAIRDFYIRRKFNQLRHAVRPKEIIEHLQEEFSYLSTETIRKIVYSRPTSADAFPQGRPLELINGNF